MLKINKKDYLNMNYLVQGSKIGIAAVAKPADRFILNHAIKELESLGCGVCLCSNIDQRYGYLAGSDAARAEGLMELFLDPTVDAIWCYGGGFGSSRILDLLDYDLISNNKKLFIGMSDITALHIALYQRADLITLLGPTVSYLYHPKKRSSAYTIKNCLRSICGNVDLSYPPGMELKVLKSGSACGPLVGGNLALISALMGTPYQLETEGKILLLEDVNEDPYKIDRMLTQLSQGGLFDKVGGVILASFDRCLAKHQDSLTLEEVFHDVFEKYSFPLHLNFPSGHIKDMVTLPLGDDFILEDSGLTISKKTNRHASEAQAPLR